MSERRKHERMPSYLGGQIAFQQRYCAIDCLIRNMSQTGARLVLSDHKLIPDEFDLMIPKKGDSRRARIAWRLHESVGVAFVEQKETLRSVEAARQIKTLKNMNAFLAKRVSDLNEPVC